ncbi:heme-binding protein [Opitutales bacterium]|nr:heme-binding protein [Opitutales bacterium]
MHEKTPVGKIMILDLPARTALEASTEKSYFSENNGLFRKLFKYINNNDISMTTPVEADIKPGKMRFFVGSDDQVKQISSSKDVTVRKLSPSKVVAIGIRGSYSEKRFVENKSKLTSWIKNNKQYEPSGEAYGVYWDGPFIPGFFKRSEIHLPVKILEKKKKQNPKESQK